MMAKFAIIVLRCLPLRSERLHTYFMQFICINSFVFVSQLEHMYTIRIIHKRLDAECVLRPMTTTMKTTNTNSKHISALSQTHTVFNVILPNRKLTTIGTSGSDEHHTAQHQIRFITTCEVCEVSETCATYYIVQ